MKNKFLKKGLVAMVVALSLVFVIMAFTACNPMSNARDAFEDADGWTVTNLSGIALLGGDEGFSASGPENGSFTIITFGTRALADAAYIVLGGPLHPGEAGQRGNTVWVGTANALAVWNG